MRWPLNHSSSCIFPPHWLFISVLNLNIDPPAVLSLQGLRIDRPAPRLHRTVSLLVAGVTAMAATSRTVRKRNRQVRLCQSCTFANNSVGEIFFFFFFMKWAVSLLRFGIKQPHPVHPLHLTLYSPDGAIHHRNIPSVPAAGSYWRHESSIQKSHNAGTRTRCRATSAAKATLNSSCSPLSPFAFFYLSPTISVAIRAAHHSMAQLGHCQTKKKWGEGEEE